MIEDKTGWEIIFDGTVFGAWGIYMLPDRESHQSEVWVTPNRRQYNRTGKHVGSSHPPERGDIGESNETE